MTATKISGLALLGLGVLFVGCGDKDNTCDTATGEGCTPDSEEPEADSDGDGIVDSEDECPDEAPGECPDPDRDGCPSSTPDIDCKPDYFDAYAFGVTTRTGYDGSGLVPYGIDESTQQDPYAGITFYEEDYFDTGDERYSCIEFFMLTEESVSSMGVDDLWAGYEVSMTWYADASSNPCEDFDPSIWGADTPISLVEGTQWGVGFGDMSGDFENTMKTAVQNAGLDWANEWAPYVFSYYLGLYDSDAGEVAGSELGWGFAFEVDESTWIPKADGDNLIPFEMSSATELPSPAYVSGSCLYLPYTSNLF